MELGDGAFGFMLAAAVAVGFAVRASFVLSSDFPLNDGGLFYVMVSDLERARYLLPEVTTYNFAEIPYAYPPLPFYIAAAVTDLARLSLTDVLRFLPLTVSTLGIVAFALLARSVLSRRTAVVAATLAFALLPRTSMWMIMGGGLTRSLGFLFAILALNQAWTLYTRGGRRFVVSTTVCSALTVLSHVEMALFLAASIVVLLAAKGRDRAGLVNSALVLVGTAALTAPWWATVAARHGLEPFAAAAQSRSVPSVEAAVKLTVFDVTNEPMLPVLAFLGLLGALVSIASRRFMLPVWLVAVGALAPWVLATVAAVPLALLIGTGTAEVLLPLLSGSGASMPALVLKSPLNGVSRSRWLPGIVMVSLVFYSTLSALLVAPFLMKGLSPDERSAMEWAAENTPASSRFLVITGDTWATDSASEWFPVLSRRESVATAQGYEWVPGKVFTARQTSHDKAEACARRDADCLEGWLRETGTRFTHVYVSKEPPKFLRAYNGDDCCWSLRASLANDPRYKQIYDGPGGVIFERRSHEGDAG